MTQRRTILSGLAGGLLAPWSAALAQSPSGSPLTVFAAASLKDVLTELGPLFAKARGGAAPVFSFAASSTLARQIEQGARADLFVSADEAWMRYLVDQRLVRAPVSLLTNRLALIAPAASTVRLSIGPGFALAAALGPGGRLSIADPDSVPAGRYARAALTSLGVWAQVEGRTARAENVRAALTFVARGEAPLGITYDTDAKVDPRVRIVALFPETSHPRIVYPAAVLTASRNPAADRLLAFLRGAEARAVFERYGFKTLGR